MKRTHPALLGGGVTLVLLLGSCVAIPPTGDEGQTETSAPNSTPTTSWLDEYDPERRAVFDDCLLVYGGALPADTSLDLNQACRAYVASESQDLKTEIAGADNSFTWTLGLDRYADVLQLTVPTEWVSQATTWSEQFDGAVIVLEGGRAMLLG